MKPSRKAKEASDLVEQIKPLFADRDPEVIGAALAELLALLLAGHHPSLREELLLLSTDITRQLIPLVLQDIDVPPEWLTH